MTSASSKGEDAAPSAKLRVLDAALAMAAAQGAEAVTTRAVAAAAGVQAPTIYRLFGDKRGLLDATVEYGIGEYVRSKATRTPDPDPVEEMRRAWDHHVAFGLANPGLFAIMEANPRSPAVAEGIRVLKSLVRLIAEAGRLRTSEERAVRMVRACCNGLVHTLIADGEASAGAGAISDATREAVLAAITTDASQAAGTDRRTSAAALRAGLVAPHDLTKGELALLDELLERLSA